jgi:hypothetical protein
MKLRKTLHLINVASNGALLAIWHRDPGKLWRQKKMAMKPASRVNRAENHTLLR